LRARLRGDGANIDHVMTPRVGKGSAEGDATWRLKFRIEFEIGLTRIPAKMLLAFVKLFIA